MPEPIVERVLRPMDSLEALSERLRALQSAWGVLAPSSLSQRGLAIVEVGRGLRRELSRLHTDGPDDPSLGEIASGLDHLATMLCEVAYSIPMQQVRSTLPRIMQENCLAVFDLLDVVALDVYETPESLPTKLALIDYLVTLLCTDGVPDDSAMPEDPVTLTPTFHKICQRAEKEPGAARVQAETEFFTGAKSEDELRNEVRRRELRARKASLGRGYFAPNTLRAIMTYNLALRRWVALEIGEARDWGEVEESEASAGESLFDSQGLHAVHAALRRRIAEEPPAANAVDRVAWALDLDSLGAADLESLRTRELSPEEPETSRVLLGLLCQSLNVLAIELQNIGIDPDHLAEHWVPEVATLAATDIREEAADAREDASAGPLDVDESLRAAASNLSELRNRFASTRIAAQRRQAAHAAASGPVESSSESTSKSGKRRREARELMSEALANGAKPESRPRAHAGGWRDWPWRRIAPAAAIAALVLGLGLHQLGILDLVRRDLDRWNRAELSQVSPHLIRGHRNGDGEGVAFVGTIAESWLQLPAAEREEAALDLVAGLRTQGIDQVMIYDRERKLRIQALGENLRTL